MNEKELEERGFEEVNGTDLVYLDGEEHPGYTPQAARLKEAGENSRIIYCHRCDTWVTFSMYAPQGKMTRVGVSDTFEITLSASASVKCHYCDSVILEGHAPQIDTLDRTM